jgi:hypothetical protein
MGPFSVLLLLVLLCLVLLCLLLLCLVPQWHQNFPAS